MVVVRQPKNSSSDQMQLELTDEEKDELQFGYFAKIGKNWVPVKIVDPAFLTSRDKLDDNTTVKVEYALSTEDNRTQQYEIERKYLVNKNQKIILKDYECNLPAKKIKTLSPVQKPYKSRKIKHINYDGIKIETYFPNQLFEECEWKEGDVIYVCPFCLGSTPHENKEHIKRCKLTNPHPPGTKCTPPGTRCIKDSISNTKKDKDNLIIWKVKASKKNEEKYAYAVNLVKLSKFFIKEKLNCVEYIQDFTFYVLTKKNLDKEKKISYSFIGYFSKECSKEDNISCIMTLPIYRRKGYGTILIKYSYFLSKKMKQIGSPERPLSSLGLALFLKYWWFAIQNYLANGSNQNFRNLNDIVQETFIRGDDILNTFEAFGELSENIRQKEGQEGYVIFNIFAGEKENKENVQTTSNKRKSKQVPNTVPTKIKK